MDYKPLSVGQEVIVNLGHTMTRGIVKEIKEHYLVIECPHGDEAINNADVYALDERDRLRDSLDKQTQWLNDQFDIYFKEGLFRE